MVQRTLAHALSTVPVGDRVRVEGWAHRRRRLGGIAFLIVRDRTGLTQIVLTGDTAHRLFVDVVEEVDIGCCPAPNDRYAKVGQARRRSVRGDLARSALTRAALAQLIRDPVTNPHPSSVLCHHRLLLPHLL